MSPEELIPGEYTINMRTAIRPGIPEKGFTLIELLTVIAIIGILAAILIPVLGRVRDQARSAVCQSNLRQVGVAVQMYAYDNNDRTPPNSGEGGTVGMAMGDRLAGLLVPPELTRVTSESGGTGGYYLDSAEVLFCPSVANEPPFMPETPGMFTEQGWIGYAWFYLVDADFDLNNTTIEPEYQNNMIAMDIGWNHWMTGNGWPRAHENTANVLFVGGHIRAVPWDVPDSTANWKVKAERINRHR